MADAPIEFHPDARAEAEAAFQYYFERSKSAAEAFYAALALSLDDIREYPERWAEYLFGTRRYLLSRFPFIVVYRPLSHRIEVVAVAHGNRKPGYWADRLQ